MKPLLACVAFLSVLFVRSSAVAARIRIVGLYEKQMIRAVTIVPDGAAADAVS